MLLKVLEIDKMALEEDEKEQVKALIREYQDCFALKMDQLGEVNLLKAQIQTGTHPPIRPLYTVSSCPERERPD